METKEYKKLLEYKSELYRARRNSFILANPAISDYQIAVYDFAIRRLEELFPELNLNARKMKEASCPV